jgi:hypothetical protein
MKRITLALLLFVTVSMVAQDGINYKAVIKDGSGVIVSSTAIDVTFIILDGASNVYEETHAPTTDANGIVILNIGEGAPVTGDFSTIDWSSNNHFLKVQIDTGSGVQDIATTAFKTVPYAMHATTTTTATTATTLPGGIDQGYIAALEARISALEPPPSTVPDAPTIGTVVAGDELASVPFTAPLNDGGSAITGYTATSSPGGLTGTLSQVGSGSIAVSGLSNGTAYTFSVTATNAIGTSNSSATSNSVTPSTVPDAPTIGTAVAGNGAASVPFTAPLGDGGSAITGYTATSSPVGFTGTLPQAGSGTITVSGLTNGTTYTFSVTATNAIGTSNPSAASNSVTPLTVPDAPIIGTAVAGNGAASVPFTAPLNDGGSPITGYTATSSPGGLTGTLSQAGSGTIAVSGLSNGTAYTFSVTATNAIGTSNSSATSNSVTPLAGPAVIGDIREGGVVFWVDPADNTRGLVCAMSDSVLVEWGCNGTDLPNVPNVISSPPTGPGAEIGDGMSNTNAILNDCPTAPTALAARSLGAEWFLPSVNELKEMYLNKTTLGAVAGFSAFNSFYWSSTEDGNGLAWFQNFSSGGQYVTTKDGATNVRAVRAF